MNTRTYTTNSSNNIPPSPATEIILSITVHERNVCFIDKLKNSLNIQKPESFTWEPKTLPVPTASTINSGDAAPDATNGVTTPAAVMPATVAEPIVMRRKAVTVHAKISGGICQRVLKAAIY